MNSNEFKEGVYNKYYKQKEIKNDDFFNNYQYKDKKINPIKIAANFVLVILTSIAICIGGLSVYATFGGKISGKPVFEWFKVSFSDEYENYRNEVHGETIQGPNESSIDLVSTVCDESMVVLEFDIKLSAEDKKYLKIGEPKLPEKYWTEEYINATDDEDSNNFEYLFDEKTKKVVIDEETGEPVIITKKQSLFNDYGDKKIEDLLIANYNLKPGYCEEFPYAERVTNRFAIIDGEYKWIQLAPQTIKQISEYEYKLYQMYFFTDKELGDKTEFNLTIKDIVIRTKEMQYGDGETCLKFDGQFDVKLSKEKAIENSKEIEVNDIKEVIYETTGLTQKIESIVVTPLQTIVKVHSTYEHIDYSQLTNSTSQDHIGPNEYKILDENGEIINSYSSEIKRKITYSDGKEEEWNTLQIDATRIPFENATLETIDCIFIEKHENNSKIKIVSQVGHGLKRLEYSDIGSFEIDLTREKKN